ncbi:superoxide dismutase, partial [Paenibacillus sp.]|uniref:superoxide dismutase n=1 Tax=Paenibacillus sp. TaxID=58172 RepID=UPI002D443DDC
AAAAGGGAAPRDDAVGRELAALADGAAEGARRWAAALLELARRANGAGPAAAMARDAAARFAALEDARRGILPEGGWSEPAALPPGPVPIGGHTLPALPYAYDALEPHLDAETIRIHHSVLHANYVKGLNEAERRLEQARETNDFALVKHWERELAFHGAGHYLHTVYFFGMSPEGGGEPDGPLAARIRADFGSFDSFRRHFAAAAEKVEGSGWALLVWSPRAGRLQILQAEKHQNLTQWDDVPVLAIDVWEHSYFLKYKQERARYVDAWFRVVNWPYAGERFEEARRLVWKPY